MIPYSGIMVIVHGSKETPNLKKQGSARDSGEAVEYLGKRKSKNRDELEPVTSLGPPYQLKKKVHRR